jgi:hypothetical protein
VIRTPRAQRPEFPDGIRFIDTHMHCGGVAGDDTTRCGVGETWKGAATEGAAGVILSIEHWTMSLPDEASEAVREQGGVLGYTDQQNEIYAATAAAEPSLAFFASLECWHDTPFGPDWEQACKDDARRWIEAGANGFKDHVGKQWQSANDGVAVADAGVFAGAWSRRAGRCAQIAGDTPNRDCVQSEEVVYPLLTEEWREVVRYIVEDLGAPIISHSTTWYGAAEQCWDPLSSSLRSCSDMSRDHLLDFLDWAQTGIEADARRRFVVAHGAFAVPGEPFVPRPDETEAETAERLAAAQALLEQLDQILSAGVSVESATSKDFMALTFRREPELGACAVRDLFARYPDQLMFGTDGLVDRGTCLASTYQAWEDLLTLGVNEQSPERDACFGRVQSYGLDLDTPIISECESEVPADALQRFLTRNFLALYE